MFVQTQMRNAMINAASRAAGQREVGHRQRAVILRVAENADVGVGIHKVQDWNAHLSFRTHERLKVMGVM